MSLSVEDAVVLVCGVEADGCVCVFYALIVNVGGEETVDGCLVCFVDHGCEPFHVGRAAQFVEAVGIGCEVVVHECSADAAPAVHVGVFGCGRGVFVAVGYVAQCYAGAVYFAYGIDLLVSVGVGQWVGVFAQCLIPVDGALVAVGFIAEFAAGHHAVGDIGAAAGCCCWI